MIPWEVLGREKAPGGGELVLYHRNGEYSIRVGGRELMSSRAHGSEEELSVQGIAALTLPDGGWTVGRPRILIGGLGLGYTARAALDVLPPEARLIVAEIVPAVVLWNRGPLAHLAGRPLEDSRCTVETTDVATSIRRATERFDAILLDVDNGPVALTRKGNHGLYTEPGLQVLRGALRQGGVLGVWSAARDEQFLRRLAKVGFQESQVDVPARGKAGGPMHTLFFGKNG